MDRYEEAFEISTSRENAAERIREDGPGLELLRRSCVAQLRAQMDAFYEHGNTADLFTLCAAFHLLQRKSECPDRIKPQAELVESILHALSLDPQTLLDLD